MRLRLKLALSLLAISAAIVPKVAATGFQGSASGAVIGSTCLATVNLEVLGGTVSSPTDGIQYNGSLARITLAGGVLVDYAPCAVTFTSTRTLNDVAGTYTLGSTINADVELLGAALNAALAALGLTVGPASITLNTFLAGNPADVATVTLDLSTLAILTSVSVSDNNSVHAFGAEVLTQQIIFSFNSSGNNLINLGAVVDVLSSPEFVSAITLDEPDPPVQIPEPGTVIGGIAALAAVIVRRARQQARPLS